MADTPWTKWPWTLWDGDIVSQSDACNPIVTLYHDTSDADARLIAAAPEYDELLGEAIDIFEGDLTGVEWKRAWRDFTRRAKALRAKARGEQ